MQTVPVENTAPASETVWMESSNLRGRLPKRVGAIAGFVGALAIILVVTIIVVATGNGLFTAPRLIASAIYGDMVMGALPIAVGTLIHLVTGTVYGFIFAAVMPPIYRTMWMVAGLIYGMLIYAVAELILIPFIAPLMMGGTMANHFVLLTAHMVFGFMLGIAGATYGRWWRLPDSIAKS